MMFSIKKEEEFIKQTVTIHNIIQAKLPNSQNFCSVFLISAPILRDKLLRAYLLVSDI